MPLRTAEGIEVLADPTRRRIVALLAARVWHPADIAAAIGLSRPAVSRQLGLLTESGLVRWRWSAIDRRSPDYFIDPRMREPIIAWLAGVDLRTPGASARRHAPLRGTPTLYFGLVDFGLVDFGRCFDSSASLEPSRTSSQRAQSPGGDEPSAA